MSHAERQAFLKTSPLGQLLGVAHLLPEVGEAKDAAVKESSLENLPTLICFNEKTFRHMTVVKVAADFKRPKEAGRFTQKRRSRLQPSSPLEAVWCKFG
jgi:hypothetical protein